MHETAQRLLEVGLAKGAKTFAEIARALGASDQSATNWKTRGVPPDVILRAAALYGAEEKRQPYLHSADEQRLLDGYRVADDSLRRSMLLLASDSLERFGRRRANHN